MAAGFLGGAFSHLDTPEYRRLSHTLSFAVNLAAFSAMLMFVALKTPGKRRRLAPTEKWAPFAVLVAASLLIMVDLTRHILLDASVAVGSLHMFNSDGSLTAAGKIGQLSSWVGNVLLFVGLVWYVLPPRACAAQHVYRGGL